MGPFSNGRRWLGTDPNQPLRPHADPTSPSSMSDKLGGDL